MTNNPATYMNIENPSDEEVSLAERYKLLIAARNFHYDNFNKWMTYFYVAIGALFIGYYSIGSEHHEANMLYMLLPVLGYIVSIFWYWSSKGYYYWITNFMTLIQYYEAKLLKFKKTERVYFVFANKDTNNNYFNPIKGANISTSKISILFSFIIAVVWGVLLITEINCDNHIICVAISTVISAILTILLGFIPKTFLTSNIKDIYDLEIKVEDLDKETTEKEMKVRERKDITKKAASINDEDRKCVFRKAVCRKHKSTK